MWMTTSVKHERQDDGSREPEEWADGNKKWIYDWLSNARFFIWRQGKHLLFMYGVCTI